MVCADCKQQLDAWIDGELPAQQARDFREHLSLCPQCSAAALDAAQLKRAVAHAVPRYTPSPEFRARIESQLRSRPRRRWSWQPIAATALAAALTVAVLAVALGIRRQSQRTWQEIADLHVTDLASATPVEVVSSDRHTVKPWFQGRLPFTFNLPELGGTDFALVGGRVAYIDGAPAAHLLFSIRKHYISVFITNTGGTGGEPSSFTGASWTQNGLRYYMISDVRDKDLEQLKGLLQAAK